MTSSSCYLSESPCRGKIDSAFSNAVAIRSTVEAPLLCHDVTAQVVSLTFFVLLLHLFQSPCRIVYIDPLLCFSLVLSATAHYHADFHHQNPLSNSCFPILALLYFNLCPIQCHSSIDISTSASAITSSSGVQIPMETLSSSNAALSKSRLTSLIRGGRSRVYGRILIKPPTKGTVDHFDHTLSSSVYID